MKQGHEESHEHVICKENVFGAASVAISMATMPSRLSDSFPVPSHWIFTADVDRSFQGQTLRQAQQMGRGWCGCGGLAAPQTLYAATATCMLDERLSMQRAQHAVSQQLQG